MMLPIVDIVGPLHDALILQSLSSNVSRICFNKIIIIADVLPTKRLVVPYHKSKKTMKDDDEEEAGRVRQIKENGRRVHREGQRSLIAPRRWNKPSHNLADLSLLGPPCSSSSFSLNVMYRDVLSHLRCGRQIKLPQGEKIRLRQIR